MKDNLIIKECQDSLNRQMLQEQKQAIKSGLEACSSLRRKADKIEAEMEKISLMPAEDFHNDLGKSFNDRF